MKYSGALFAVLSLAAASVVSVTSSPIIDTNESGLQTLGQRSHERKARHVQLASRAAEGKVEALEGRDMLSKNGKLTWYGGGQLDNPACGGPTPTDDSMIVAVQKNGGYGKCGDTVHLHHNGKMVAAKIVDYCAGCGWGHFDATKGVFKKLAPISQGVIEGMHFKLLTN